MLTIYCAPQLKFCVWVRGVRNLTKNGVYFRRNCLRQGVAQAVECGKSLRIRPNLFLDLVI